MPISLLSDQDPILGLAFEDALVFSARLHARQLRKTSGAPYVAHLLMVCAMVIEDGGSEAEAIAALLHDAVEDQGGAPTLALIRTHFGDEVSDIVAGCSEIEGSPKPPWRERKQAYLAHLAGAPAPVLRVALADKVHNASCFAVDLETLGPAAWDHYNAGAQEQMWWWHSLESIFQDRLPGSRARDLSLAVRRIERASGQSV